MGFSKKRFLVSLGLSIVVWLISVAIQGITLYKVKFSLFSGSACEITGYPIAQCIYDGIQAGIIQLINVLFWFFVIHLFWGWMDKGKSKS